MRSIFEAEFEKGYDTCAKDMTARIIELAQQNARLRAALTGVLNAVPSEIHVGYDGGGNFVYAEAIRVDDPAFAAARAALAK